MPTDLPEYPCQQVGTDLFTFKGREYLIVVDYISQYPEIARIPSTTSQGIILALKKVFSQHELKVIMDHSTVRWNLLSLPHLMDSNITSSPYFPQTNECAERTIQTVKRMLLKSKDPFLALLVFSQHHSHNVS